MKLKVQNKVASENPSSDDIETALHSLDGYRRQQVTLVDPNGISLTFSRRRDPKFHVSIEAEQDDLIVRKSGKRLLKPHQAVAAAQAWARGESEWPLLMRWSESVDMTEEAHQQDLKEVERNWRERPWETLGWTVLLFFGVSAVQLLLYVPADYYADRGFASFFLGEPSLEETIVINAAVMTVVNILIGLWLWEQHLAEREDS